MDGGEKQILDYLFFSSVRSPLSHEPPLFHLHHLPLFSTSVTNLSSSAKSASTPPSRKRSTPQSSSTGCSSEGRGSRSAPPVRGWEGVLSFFFLFFALFSPSPSPPPPPPPPPRSRSSFHPHTYKTNRGQRLHCAGAPFNSAEQEARLRARPLPALRRRGDIRVQGRFFGDCPPQRGLLRHSLDRRLLRRALRGDDRG